MGCYKDQGAGMNNIFIAYITVTISGILVVYLYELLRRRRTVVEERIIVNCPVCTHRYIVDGMEKIHRCPQCNSLNKA